MSQGRGTKGRVWILGALCAGLGLGAGCKGAEPKPDEPVTQQETQVESKPPPDAEALMASAQAPAPDEERPEEGAPQAPQEEEAPQQKKEAVIAPIDGGVARKVERAMASATEGDLSSASQALAKLVDEPNGGYLAAYNLGVVRESQANYEQAAQAYVKALGSNPDFTPALVNLTRLYVRQGRASDARMIADRYTAARPQNLGHRVALLEVGLAQERYEDVIRDAKELLRREERNVDAMLAMAEANYRLKRYELAKAILTRATKIAPKRGEIYYKYGLIELKRDDQDAARANFEQAIQVQPRYPEARNNLGVLYHEARDYDNAIAQYRAALKTWPDFKQALLNLGNAHKGKGEFRDAEVAFRKAIEVDGDFADAHFNLAILYLESELPGIEKIPRLQKAIDTLNSYKGAARGKLSKGDPADAYIAEARKAIEDEKARQEMMRQSQMEVQGEEGAAEGEEEME